MYGKSLSLIHIFITLPGKKHAGKILPQLISNGVDFFASICDWAGAEIPKNATGKSFRKIVEEGNPQSPHQDYIITETQFDGSKTRGWMVRSKRYKYCLLYTSKIQLWDCISSMIRTITGLKYYHSEQLTFDN